MIDANRINGPDGILGPHRKKRAAFFALREIFSPVQIQLRELPADFDGTLPVENRYHFTSLDKCSFRWQLVQFRAPSDVVAGQVVTASGEVRGPAVNPFGNGLCEAGAACFLERGRRLGCYRCMMRRAPDSASVLEDSEQCGDCRANRAQNSAGRSEGVRERTGCNPDCVGHFCLCGQEYRNHHPVALCFGLPLPFKNGPVLVSSPVPDVPAACTGVEALREDDGYVVEATFRAR